MTPHEMLRRAKSLRASAEQYAQQYAVSGRYGYARHADDLHREADRLDGAAADAHAVAQEAAGTADPGDK